MIDRPVVLATRNSGKIAEFKTLFSGFPVQIKSLNDFGPIPEAVEDGKTFEDNAYKKAHFTARVVGLPALEGQPGVLSARYAGEGAGDEANIRKLLKAMEGVSDRRAAFECVIAIAVPRGPALLYSGRCEGEIARDPSGKNGFGYDPVFFYPALGKTFAEMSQEEKNQISHRGKAMAKLLDEFDKVLKWLEQRLAEEPF
jgi:XTP/dITP diphosphohydrolase